MSKENINYYTLLVEACRDITYADEDGRAANIVRAYTDRARIKLELAKEIRRTSTSIAVAHHKESDPPFSNITATPSEQE